MNANVTQDPEKPILPEILAESIKRLGDSVKQWDARLKRRALILLLHDQSGVPITMIDRVLNAMVALEREYVVKPK